MLLQSFDCEVPLLISFSIVTIITEVSIAAERIDRVSQSHFCICDRATIRPENNTLNCLHRKLRAEVEIERRQALPQPQSNHRGLRWIPGGWIEGSPIRRIGRWRGD